MPLPDLPELCRLEELRQARGTSEVADAFEPIAGGVMARGPAGSWLNCAVGLGLDAPVPASEIKRLVAYYDGAGIEPRIEVAPYADDTLVRGLAEAGFVLRVFETIFARPLAPAERVVQPHPPTIEGLSIVAVDPADDAMVLAAARVVAAGFSPPGGPVRPEDLETWRRCARHPRTTTLAAMLGHRCVGAGSLEVAGPIAALFGLAVDPEFRRHGVQQALMSERLTRAARHGATFATISARPRVATNRNALRLGFAPAYTKVTLVRPATGLAPVCS